MQVMTIGYEGIVVARFVELLAQADVKRIVDVRELPLSRKKGFSKRALAAILAEHNTGYVHMRALGCPKPIRHEYRADSDWDHYSKRFLSYLRDQNEAMDQLDELVAAEQCCLLCFEANAYECHRSLVAQRLKALWQPNLIINHLRTNQTAAPALVESLPL